MAKFILQIDLDNAAFDPDPSEEVARLLQVAKDQIEAGFVSAPSIDTNGNIVGRWYFSE